MSELNQNNDFQVVIIYGTIYLNEASWRSLLFNPDKTRTALVKLGVNLWGYWPWILCPPSSMVPETSLWSYWTRFLGFCPGLNFMVHAIVIYNLAFGLNSIQVLIELLKNEVCQQHCVFRSWKPLSPWLFGEEIHFAIYVLILQRSSLELRFSSWAWISQKVREVRFCLSSMNGVFFEWVSIKRTGSWNFYSGLKPVPSISFFFAIIMI